MNNKSKNRYERNNAKSYNSNLTKDKIFTLVDIIFTVCLLVIVILGFIFAPKLDKSLNNITNEFSSNLSIKNGIKAHFLDVGQALCTIIELPDDKLLMYDTGLEESAESIIKYITKNIKTDNIELLILSHTDSDHIGGALKILERFNVKNIVRPIVKSVHTSFDENLSTTNMNNYSSINDELYANVLKQIYNETTSVFDADYNNIEQLNNIFDGEKYNIQFYLPQFYISSNMNDFSSIITITYNGQSLMLTGDATQKTESNILNNYNVPDVNFLALAHHGSNTSSSIEFLHKVKPEYVYISVGKNNAYNHPHLETLNKLSYLEIKPERIYSTSECGDIILAFNGQKIENVFDCRTIKTIYILIGAIILYFIIYFKKLIKYAIQLYVKIKRKKSKK